MLHFFDNYITLLFLRLYQITGRRILVIPEEYHPDRVPYCHGNETKIKEDIYRIREKVDFIIISLHWGDEYIQKPSLDQIILAKMIIDQGADIILGHHPHVIQGIETYKNKLIAYSLGNFIFDMWMPKTRESILLQIELNKKGIKGFNVVPVKANCFYQPDVVDGKEAKILLTKFEKLCDIIKQANYTDREYQIQLSAVFREYRKSVPQHYKAKIMKYNIFYFIQLIFLIFWRRFSKCHI